MSLTFGQRKQLFLGGVCVLLYILYVISGIIVKCHEERSLHRNRERARQMLTDKLDELYNGEMSVAAQLRRLQEANRSKAQQKTQKREAMKKAWREREGID